MQATAERGEAVNDFGPPVEKEIEGRTATLKGEVGHGPIIRLTASRGAVSVRKEGPLPSEIPPAPAKAGRRSRSPRTREVIL
ncbi:hypothetical protein SBA4_960024 [Candidatus Sulfopaludibacter sp. SbA4]|nr:hypothetical protein SBA4_960024 [Candidatus Sulfopaludibacter sp. SbA4]